MRLQRSLAAAQTIPVRGDVGANVERHLRLVDLAAQRQARLLLFPELSLTGYEIDLAEGLAFSPSDPRLLPLVAAASAASMTLIVGAPIRIGDRLHLGAFVLTPGRGVEIYTKHHLGAFSPGAAGDAVVPPAEATVFHPGRSNPLVRVGDGSAALAICADTGRPSHSQAAAERGAKTYLASMFVIPSHLEGDLANLQACAARHAMAVVFANFGGPSGGLASGGRSAIWSERGELLAQLDAAGSGLAVAIETDAGWRATTLMLDGH